MLMDRQSVMDLLTDLERDARRQSPATIRFRRKLAEVAQLMEQYRMAEISVHLKKHAADRS